MGIPHSRDSNCVKLERLANHVIKILVCAVAITWGISMEATYICYITYLGRQAIAIFSFFGPMFCVYRVFSVMAVIVCFGRLICDIMRTIIIFGDSNHVVNFLSSHSSQFKSHYIILSKIIFPQYLRYDPKIDFEDYLFFLVNNVGPWAPG